MWTTMLVLVTLSGVCFFASGFYTAKKSRRSRPVSSRRILKELHERGLCDYCKTWHSTDREHQWVYKSNRTHLIHHVSRGYLPWEDVPEGWKTDLLQAFESFSEEEVETVAKLILEQVIEPEWIPQVIRYRVLEKFNSLIEARISETASPAAALDLEVRREEVEKQRTT